IDDKADGLAADNGTMRLAFWIQSITARGPYRCTGLVHPATFEVENVLVRKCLCDYLDEPTGRRYEFGEPRNAASLCPTIAQDLELHDVIAIKHRASTVEGCAARPRSGANGYMLRCHFRCLSAVFR